MRPTTPRVPLLTPDELDPDLRERFGGGPLLNIFAALANHPKLLKRWLVFGSHVLAKSSLPPRERELVILRVGARCGAEYEWGQHATIGQDAGLTREEVERTLEDADAPGWSDFDRALIVASDELCDEACLSDASWQALTQKLSHEQCIDLIFTVGQYQLVSMALNSLGVPLDEGVEGFPASEQER